VEPPFGIRHFGSGLDRTHWTAPVGNHSPPGRLVLCITTIISGKCSSAGLQLACPAAFPSRFSTLDLPTLSTTLGHDFRTPVARSTAYQWERQLSWSIACLPCSVSSKISSSSRRPTPIHGFDFTTSISSAVEELMGSALRNATFPRFRENTA
jgi:hypothetical protein